MEPAGSQKVVITSVEPGSPGLEQVKALWRRYSATLGFFADGAFVERAQKRQILAAISDESVIGYVTFFRNRRDEIRITHLCVDESHQRRGVARELIQALIARAQNAVRIRLWCRRDFTAACKAWERLGFVPFDEKPGKKESGSVLTGFCLELGPLPLFAGAPSEPEGPTIVVDANVFYDLVVPERPFYEESSGLQEDWLAAETQLLISDEMFVDIQRSLDSDERQSLLKEARRWERIEASPQEVQAAEQLITEILGRPESERDRSDQLHLAWAVAGKADAFATRDEPLLDNRDEIYDKTGLLVGRPAELVAEYDDLINERDYQLRELTGSGVQRTRIATTRQFTPDAFIDSHVGESAKRFRAAIDAAIAHPADHEVWQVADKDGRLLAVYVLTMQADGTLGIKWLRLSRAIIETRLGRSLIRFLLTDIQRRAAEAGFDICRLDDARAAAWFAAPLRERGFVACEGQWWKLCLPGIWKPDQIHVRLNDRVRLGSLPNELAESLVTGLATATEATDVGQLLNLEGLIWPGKIISGFVDNFVIPIRPSWAADLFDIDLRNRPLLEAETDLLLNPDCAYYKAAGGAPTVDCGRILWYVSQHEDYPQAGRIRACSRMTERVSGPALTVYRRFRHLGVYQWRDVREAADDKTGLVTALGFTDTEPLAQPLGFHEANDILERYSRRSTFVSATRVPEEAFFAIYQESSGFCSSADRKEM